MALFEQAYYAYYEELEKYLIRENKTINGKVDTNLLSQMMDFYMENVLTAGADPEKVIELVNQFPKEQQDRELRGLEAGADEKKIHASAIARKTYSDFVIALETNDLRHKINNRELKTLCRLKDPSVKYTEQELKAIDDWNDKIERLFGGEGLNNPDLQNERATLIKDYMNECMDVLSHTNQMVSPELEEKELRKNMWDILIRSKFLAEVGKMTQYVEQDGEVFNLIVENDAYCQNAGFLNNTRIVMMANPLYGKLDVNALHDYDIDKAGGEYADSVQRSYLPIEDRSYAEAVFENIDKKIKAGTASELDRLLAGFHTYVKTSNTCNVYNDVTKCFCQDTNFFYQCMSQNDSNEYRDIAVEFRFTDAADNNRLGEDTECFSELPSEEGGNLEVNEHTDARTFGINKTPVAFKKGRRVIVVSTSDNPENGATTTLEPQTLYNYSLKSKNAEYLARLEAVDSARLMMVNTMTKSPFNKIMRCMKRIDALPELGSQDPLADITRSENEFKMLKSLCEEYITYKNEQNKTLKQAEQTRLDTVKALKDYADIKLKELNLVETALETIDMREEYKENYKNIMADNDILIEMDKIQPQIKAHLEVVNTQIDRYLNLDAPLPGKLLTGLKVLKSELKDSFGSDRQHKQKDALKKCIGLMSTAQMILKEREGLAEGEERGRLENAFLDENGRAYQEEWLKRTGKEGFLKAFAAIPDTGTNYDERYRILAAFNNLDVENTYTILPDNYVDENICILNTVKNERFKSVGIKRLEERIKDLGDNAIIKEAYDHVSELIKHDFGFAQDRNFKDVAKDDIQPAKELLGYNTLIRLAEKELRDPEAEKYMSIYVHHLGMKEVLECIMQSNAFKERYGVLYKNDVYNDVVEPDDYELARFSVKVGTELPGLLRDRLEKSNNEMQKKYENFKVEALKAAGQLNNFKDGEFAEAHEKLMLAITNMNFFENGNAKNVNSKISGDDIKNATDIVAYITGMTAVQNDRYLHSLELANVKVAGAKKQAGELALEELTRVPAENLKKTVIESNTVKNVLKDMTYAQLYKFVTDKTTRNSVANKTREELAKPKARVMGRA